jgi:hypothetical protein
VLVVLAVGALAASLALLMARLGSPASADLLAVISAACGLAAFVSAAHSTFRQARRLPGREERP